MSWQMHGHTECRTLLARWSLSRVHKDCLHVSQGGDLVCLSSLFSVFLFDYFYTSSFNSVFFLFFTCRRLCFPVFSFIPQDMFSDNFLRSEDSTSSDFTQKAVNQPNMIVRVPEFKPRVGDTPCYFVG